MFISVFKSYEPWITGNLEIGNGYGVPGGGAYAVAPRPDVTMPSKIKQPILFK